MGAATRTAGERELQRQITVELWAKGYSVYKIADHPEITVSAKQVHHDLKAMRQQWAEVNREHINQRMQEELAKLDNLEHENWKAFEDTGRTDPRWLEAIRRVIEMRCKLLGIIDFAKAGQDDSDDKTNYVIVVPAKSDPEQWLLEHKPETIENDPE